MVWGRAHQWLNPSRQFKEGPPRSTDPRQGKGEIRGASIDYGVQAAAILGAMGALGSQRE